MSFSRTLASLVSFLFIAISHAAENPADFYLYRNYCPSGQSVTRENQTAVFPGADVSGGWFNYLASKEGVSWITRSYFVDQWGFAQCNCTSYVAGQLNQLWGQAPGFANGYYNLRDSSGNQLYWSDAKNWRNRALAAGIGVTGARDNFTWDESSYNAVFPGDVAWWDAWNSTSGRFGHVGSVVNAERDTVGNGVKCVTVRQYNWLRNEFNETRLCKGQRDSNNQPFPDAFLHIDQDHIYCLQHPDQCPGFLSGTGGGAGGRGGSGAIGGSADTFNLKVNDFWVKDLAYGLDLTPEADTVRTGEVLQARIQVKAVNGDTHDHMRAGKDTIEIDVYVREDFGEWNFLKREYIQATNLPNGATHTEHVDYTVPAGVSEVSFKAKIDAEDEAWENNEGDNWTEIQTFQVNNSPTYDLIITSAAITTMQPVPVGSPMGASFTIRNIGDVTPPMATRSCYDINGPGTNGLWQNIASDQSDGGTLTPGVDQYEQINALVPAPTVPGTYTLRVTANCTNGVPESDYTNNSLSITFQVAVVYPKLVITRFEDKVGCCTTNTGAAPKPRIWVRNDGAAPTANVMVVYQVSSPLGTGGVYQNIGYGTIEPRELAPGDTDEDQMDCDGCWRIPKSSAWKKQWHNFRACLRQDGSFPTGDPNQGDICAVYSRYSKE